MSSSTLLRIGAIILLAGALLCAFAQQAITSATVSGRVEDPTGAVLAGSEVAAINVETNQRWDSQSDAHGLFRFLYLPAGAYQLKVASAGFAPIMRSFNLTLGQALEVPVRMSVETASEIVEVSSLVPVVELVRTQVAETVTPEEVDRLPLNGRNYLDLALLAPSVSRTNTGSNQRFAETSAVPGTGISVSSQRNLSNGFVVDGLSANDDAADLAGTFYSQEVIRELQVVSSGGIAEFGRASSGTINIITHSGSNQFHGGAYGFFRNQRLDATNALATHKDPLTQTQYGATLGGPILRDRTFFFSNFEQMRQHAAGIVTISPGNAAAINSRLVQVNYGGARVQSGQFDTALNATNFFVKVDHRLNASNQFSARYSLYDISSANARTVGGLHDVSRGSNLENRDQTVALSNLATINNSVIHETRFQFTRSRLAAPVNDLAGPAVNIAGVANFGTATSSPTARSLDVYELVDNVSIQKGAHLLKTGADFLYNRVNITFPGAVQGVYTFSSLANFRSGRYVTFQQAFGASNQVQSNPNLGVFVQDEWRVHPQVTLNLGLRYDIQLLPDPIHADGNNFAPRVGVAYAPGNGKTVIRASYGISYDRIPLRATSNALQRDGVKYKLAVLAFGQPGAPAFPNVLPDFPAELVTSITSINPHIESGYAQQAGLQIERELTASMSLSVGYLYLRGEHLIMSHNVNVPTSPTAPNLGRPDARFGNNSQFDSMGDSYYHGMMVSLNKRTAAWGSFRLSYNLSKAIDTAGNFFFSTPQDSFNIRGERGLSDNDQRHRMSISGTLQVPKGEDSWWRRAASGFRLGYIFAYTSALPFNIQSGSDRNGDTNVNDRPAGVGRNTGRGFNFASLDLRLSRLFNFGDRLRFELLAEGFNVLNRRNYQFPNNTFGTGTTPRTGFGLPTAAAEPRQVQLGMRLNF
jgi:hypothetical protein